MKKLFIIVCLMGMNASVFACEFCGCSSGNYFIGPFPKFNKYFIGTRYTFRNFHTTLASDPGQFSKDFYQTAEVWGGVNLGRRWQVLGFIPYNFNQQVSDDGVSQINGMGDVTLMINYNLIKTKSASGIQQRVWIGGGIKMPTGKYVLDADQMNPSANAQPGTGSTDWIANAMYTLTIDRWSINASTNFKLNQAAEGFLFGNRWASSVFAYRSIPSGTVTFNPTVGLLHETLAANEINGVKVEGTGGRALLAATGLDTNFRRMTLGFNVQLPLAQHYSEGQTTVKLRGMVHLTFTF